MRTFEHFNKNDICPICKSNVDKPCTLIPIDGTVDDDLVEAQPVHVDCLNQDGWHMNQHVGIIYRFI